MDGSASALSAVRLATRDASQRGSTLRIIHVLAWPLVPVDVAATPQIPYAAMLADAEYLLAEAMTVAAGTDPAVSATTEMTTGNPAAVLLDAARGTDLVVVGKRGRGGFAGLLLGSVAVQVVTHSTAPVLVARGEEHPAAPVVLGLDDSIESAPAVREAFAAACRRDADLLAVHVLDDTAVLATTFASTSESGVATPGEQVHSGVLADAHALFPRVPVRADTMTGNPGRLLIQLSELAQLMVVGARGCGGFSGLLLGSVSQQLLHHAACPVLVVRR
ncbi:universal stress protein [Catellatospora citrea]|uniref:universal stress protein n=1 Tax=Catellatospora citrea TaxID=53366 RepID=UPI0033D363DD